MKMEGLYSALQNPAASKTESRSAEPARYHKVLYMVENERMGGKVPAWKTERIDTDTTSSKGFEAVMTSALNGESQNITDAAIALNPSDISNADTGGKPFSFGDLVDMANPLHHIPVVNYAYRGITGDQIRPISQIVGGAIFGGPVGAASGIVNAAIREETGKDLGEHALSAFSSRTASYGKPAKEEELPTSLLAYTAPDLPRTQSMTVKRAPQQVPEQIAYPDLDKTPTYREPITELLLNTGRKSL